VQHHTGVERLDRQRPQQRSLGGEAVPDAVGVAGDPARLVRGFPPLDALVELVQAFDLGHRGQVVAAEPAHRPLDAALLMRPVEAGLAVERVEPVVRAEQDPPVVLVAGPAGTLDDLGDRGGQVVVLDVPGRDAADRLERFDVALQERFLRLGRVDPVDGLAGMREPQHEHVALGPHPADHDPDLAEVDLGLLAGGVLLGDERLRPGRPPSRSICARRTRT
jgi:hypothetical protein